MHTRGHSKLFDIYMYIYIRPYIYLYINLIDLLEVIYIHALHVLKLLIGVHTVVPQVYIYRCIYIELVCVVQR